MMKVNQSKFAYIVFILGIFCTFAEIKHNQRF